MADHLTIKNDLDICLISLETQRVRRDRLLSAMADQGLVVRTQLAVDGKALPAESYFRQCRLRSSRYFQRKILTPAELGCWLSHQSALKTFLQSNKRWLMVLEDDVTIDGDLMALLTQLPDFPVASIAILGGQNGLKSFKRVIFRRVNKQGWRQPLFGTHRWLYRTCCYLLDINAAIQLLQLMAKSAYLIDDWAYVLKNTTINKLYYQHYFSHPEDLAHSSIEQERLFIDKW